MLFSFPLVSSRPRPVRVRGVPKTKQAMIMNAMKTNANTFELPEEILEQIFGYLEQADLARVANVNTVFWRLAVARLYHEIRFDPYAYQESQLRVLKSSPHLSSLVRSLTIDIGPLKRDSFQDEIQEFKWDHPLGDGSPISTARSALLALIPFLHSLRSVECYDLSGESHTSHETPWRSLMRCLFIHCPKLQKLTRTDWWRDLGCTYDACLNPASVGIGVDVSTTRLTHLTISVPESYFFVDTDGLVGVDDGACGELRALLKASPGLQYLDFYRGRISMGLIFCGRRINECDGRRSNGRKTTGNSYLSSASSSSSSLPCSLTPPNFDLVVLPNLKTLVLWATCVEEKASELVDYYLSTSAGIFPLLTGLEMVTVRCEKEGLYAADQINGQQLMDAIKTLRDYELRSIVETQAYDLGRPSPTTEELHRRMMNEKHGRQRDRRSRFRQ